MTNAQKAITPRHITDHFSSWGGYCTLRDGFLDWAYDLREETLAALQFPDDDAQLIEAISYSVRQCEEFRTAEQADVDRAAQGFLEHHRDELIEALQDSLDEWPEDAAQPIELWRALG